MHNVIESINRILYLIQLCDSITLCPCVEMIFKSVAIDIFSYNMNSLKKN